MGQERPHTDDFGQALNELMDLANAVGREYPAGRAMILDWAGRWVGKANLDTFITLDVIEQAIDLAGIRSKQLEAALHEVGYHSAQAALQGTRYDAPELRGERVHFTMWFLRREPASPP